MNHQPQDQGADLLQESEPSENLLGRQRSNHKAKSLGSVSLKPQHPVDTGWSWVVMIGVFAIHFLTTGYIRSFGLLFVEFQQYFESSSAITASMNGVQMLSYSITTFFTMNILLKYVTVRTSCLAGSFMQLLSLVCNSLVTDIRFLLLTHGFIYGCGQALIYCPAMVILSQYFDKKRPIATVIATSGVSVGGATMPFIIRFLIDNYSLRGGLLLIGAVIFHQAVFVSFFTPPSEYDGKNTEKSLDVYESCTEVQKTPSAPKYEEYARASDPNAVVNGCKNVHNGADALSTSCPKVISHAGLYDARSDQSLLVDEHGANMPGLKQAGDICRCSAKSSEDVHRLDLNSVAFNNNALSSGGKENQIHRLPNTPNGGIHCSSNSIQHDKVVNGSIQSVNAPNDSDIFSILVSETDNKLQIPGHPRVKVGEENCSDLPLSSYSRENVECKSNHNAAHATLSKFGSPQRFTGGSSRSVASNDANISDLLQLKPDEERPRHLRIHHQPLGFQSETLVRALSASNIDVLGSAQSLSLRGSHISVRRRNVQTTSLGRAQTARAMQPQSETRSKSSLRKCKCRIPAVVRMPCFWLVTMFFCGGGVASFLPFNFLPPMAKSVGLDTSQSSVFLVVSALFEMLGRLLPGMVLHFGYMRPSTAVIPSMVSCGILLQLVRFFTDFRSILALSCLIGLFTGAFWAMQVLIVIEVIGMDSLGPAFGFYSIVLGVSVSASFPLAGMLVDATDGFTVPYHFFGAAYLMASLAMVLIQFTKRATDETDSDHSESDSGDEDADEGDI